MKLPFFIESQLAKNTGKPKVAYFRRRVRGGTDDNDLTCSYITRITLRGAIVAGAMSLKWLARKKIFPSNSVRLFMGSLKEDK
jgi:hypothetical protein